jgi:hypothetical protein
VLLIYIYIYILSSTIKKKEVFWHIDCPIHPSCTNPVIRHEWTNGSDCEYDISVIIWYWYSVPVNQVMVETVYLSKWWPQLPQGSLGSVATINQGNDSNHDLWNTIMFSWYLHCLSFFDLRILTIHVVSSNCFTDNFCSSIISPI